MIGLDVRVDLAETCDVCDGTGLVTVEYADSRGEHAERVETCECIAGERQADLEVDDDRGDRAFDALEREVCW